MSEAKFTKGEWTVNDEGGLIEINSMSGTVGTVWGFDPDHTGCNISEESHCNAHLIAAAPDMYAMLEKLSGQLTDINAHRAADEVEMLLAKARGEV